MNHLGKIQLEQLKTDIEAVIKDINLDFKRSRLGELQTKSMEEDFWKDNLKASKVMSEIETITSEIAVSEKLGSEITDLIALYETLSEGEHELLIPNYEEIRTELSKFETLKFLSNKYDQSDAFLSIHSGQGGEEANDWTEMLLRMYTRYVEKNGWKSVIEHIVPGSQSGLSTVTIRIEGVYAYGKLKRESGTHRLVRLSPFNAQNLRQTSFAGVEVIPIIEDQEDEIEIPDTDIEFKAVRSGGPGGQSVNKTSSAVQIKHIPSGIAVHSSEQKSQSQNRVNAMRILKAKLWRIEEEKRDMELKKLKGEHKVAGWGNQIRNYVLHPYKLVKDLRTGTESSDPESVLAGDLDEFVESEIRL